MTDETITLALSGEVTLSDFAAVVGRLWGLLDAMSRRDRTEWILEDLARNGAVMTYRGEGRPDAIERAVRTYEEIGEALERREPKRIPPGLRRRAVRLVEVLNGRIDSMRFETARKDATVTAMPDAVPAPRGEVPLGGAYGAVQGRVQTLSNRGSLHFILYDTLNDRPVSCYLAPGQDNEELMKDAWGRLAVVEGWVKRDALTGRAQTVRGIAGLGLVPEPEEWRYREARRAMPFVTDGTSPEEAVRRLRDA